MAPQPQASAASSGLPKALCGPLGDQGPQFGNQRLRQHSLLFNVSIYGCFPRFVSASVYYGVSWAVSGMSGEMYRDYILAMLIEIPALLLSIYAMNK